MTEDIRIRRLAEHDWDAIVALECRAYSASGLSEGRDALRAKGHISPGTCFVLEYRGLFGGYLLALPYPRLRCPDLGSAENPGTGYRNLHTHDMVISEQARGRGLSATLLNHVADTARRSPDFDTVSLVAVHDTETRWAALGYRAHPEIELPENYGIGAVYMSMTLDA
ncbi:GNAT family N-acetyltransferase [Nocardia sp. NPDC127579]|uniref:GNAT family N-acetyltransferase n=1 Tax=Nocardia sp. NPDC127579 TaxID=3345402 RepID=UPI003641401C